MSQQGLRVRPVPGLQVQLARWVPERPERPERARQARASVLLVRPGSVRREPRNPGPRRKRQHRHKHQAAHDRHQGQPVREPGLLDEELAPALPESVQALRALVPALEQARRPEASGPALPESVRLEPMKLQARLAPTSEPRHQKQPWCTAQTRRQPE